jgi:hypothetical protein
MIKKPMFAVAVVSALLLVYCILVHFESQSPLIYFIFSISPLLLLWMAYAIIRHGIYDGKELEQDDEWGYQDTNKEELGVF